MAEGVSVVGVILAGGLSRRMGGGDKSLAQLGGRTILSRVADRLATQVPVTLLNANGDPARLGVALPVISDTVAGHVGPLAGILGGLDHVAAHIPGAEWLLSVPADCPFLPPDLMLRLKAALSAAPAACAASGGRLHPVIGLWPVEARHVLRDLLVAQGERRASSLASAMKAATVEWPSGPYDPFFNINTPAELAQAEQVLAAYPDA